MEIKMKAQLKEENKKKREDAEKRIALNTEFLRKQFTDAAKLKDEAERSKSMKANPSIQRFDTVGKSPIDP